MVHQILYSFLLVTSEFLIYYHCLSVYGVQLTVLGIRLFIYESLWLSIDIITSATQQIPVLLLCQSADTNQYKSIWYTLIYEIGPLFFVYRNVPFRSKNILEWERRILIGQYGNVFCHFGFKAPLCQATAITTYVSLNYEYFMLCQYILGIREVNYYFHCPLLTGYSQLKPSLSKVFLNEPWQAVRTPDVTTTLGRRSDV